MLRELESDAGDDELPELPESADEAAVAAALAAVAAGGGEREGIPPARPSTAGAQHAQQQGPQAMDLDAASMPAAGPAGPPGGAPKQEAEQQLPVPAAAQDAGELDWLLGLGGGGGGGGDMMAFGAVLGPLEAADPIARRTRAHHNLHDISLEELEQMLQVQMRVGSRGCVGVC